MMWDISAEKYQEKAKVVINRKEMICIMLIIKR